MRERLSEAELAAMRADGLCSPEPVTVRLSAETTNALALGGVGELAVRTVVDASAPSMDRQAA